MSCFRSLLAAAWLASVGGCFVESHLPTDEATPNQPQCVSGAVGCACLEGSACDPTLICLAEASVCVPEDCEPGAPHCPCDAGSCVTGWVCDGQVCLPAVPSDDDGGDDSPEGDDDVGDSDTGSTDDTAETGTEDDSGDTGDGGSDDSGEVDDGGSSEDDAGQPIACDVDMSCGECFGCAADDAMACGVEADTCESTAGCPVLAQCLVGCSVDGLCLDDCCTGHSDAAVTAAYALEDCRRDLCIGACGSYSNAPCSG